MSKYSVEEIVDNFLDHIRYLKVKHHVPGRIRVKATWSGAKKLATGSEADIKKIIAMIPGINEYRMNPKALSVVINYNDEILSFQLWEDISMLGEFPLHRDKVRGQLLDILNRTKEEV